jgi:serine/threonine-protein kinase
LALVAAGAIAWAIYERTKGPDTAKVPRLVGANSSVARARLAKRGFKVRLDGETSNQPAGLILKQAPQPGRALEKGSLVGLSVSLGPPTVTVPNLIGLKEGAAVRLVKSLKLKEFHQVVAAASTPGAVFNQNPNAGVKVAKGSVVNFLVATGPRLVTVPNVRGFLVKKATRTLTAAGLVPRTHAVQSAEPLGTVVAQAPARGEQVRRGSEVRINVSRGGGAGTTTGPTTTTATTTGTTTTTP